MPITNLATMITPLTVEQQVRALAQMLGIGVESENHVVHLRAKPRYVIRGGGNSAWARAEYFGQAYYNGWEDAFDALLHGLKLEPGTFLTTQRQRASQP